MAHNVYVTQYGEVKISQSEFDEMSRIEQMLRDIKFSWLPLGAEDQMMIDRLEDRLAAFKRDCEKVALWKWENSYA